MEMEADRIAGEPGVRGHVDGDSKLGAAGLTKEKFNGPIHMSFQRGHQDLYIADYNNGVIRKMNKDGFVSTVHGEPVGEPWTTQGFGRAGERTAQVKQPVGQGSRTTFPASFKGPANALIATELWTEGRLFVSDNKKKLSVLDVYQQHLDTFCSSADGANNFVCSQAAGNVAKGTNTYSRL